MDEAIEHTVELTADIVSAFVSNHPVRAAELPDLIASVHLALSAITAPKPVEEPVPELKPAVSIKKSVTDDYLTCLDDGKKFKSMRRHLAQLGMTPEQYRTKWGLPHDYPMVAPGYAAKRSELAKTTGLGSNRRMGPTVPAAVASEQGSAVEIEPAILAALPEMPKPETVEQRVKRSRGRPKKAA